MKQVRINELIQALTNQTAGDDRCWWVVGLGFVMVGRERGTQAGVSIAPSLLDILRALMDYEILIPKNEFVVLAWRDSFAFPLTRESVEENLVPQVLAWSQTYYKRGGGLAAILENIIEDSDDPIVLEKTEQ